MGNGLHIPRGNQRIVGISGGGGVTLSLLGRNGNVAYQLLWGCSGRGLNFRAYTQIAGVLTVIKPTINIAGFMDAKVPHIINIGMVSIAAAILLSLAVSIWLTQQVNRLTHYANDVREGRRVSFRKLAPTELKTMGNAVEKMREALAGHAYVEQYVQTLTHEIKSPISAIRGAAELLLRLS